MTRLVEIRRFVDARTRRDPSQPLARPSRTLSMLLGAIAVGVSLWVVFHPLFSCTYPPITDLPFHASSTAIFRHWSDPSWHFKEQFDLAPLSVPYMSSYALGAALMLFFDTVTAVKLATGIMLLAIPAGSATLAWGMRKSPLLGLASLPLVWGNLTHWGFINFVSAIGMFLGAVGLAMRIVDRPSRRNRIALALLLTLLFFTHVFRFPITVAGVIATAAVLYPATKRFRPILLPLAPSVALFALWWMLRPAAATPDFSDSTFHIGRLNEIPTMVVDGFDDATELELATKHLQAVGIVAIVGFVSMALARKTKRAERFELHAGLVGFGALACTLYLYLTLPMGMGVWFYVYPREATTVVLVAIALVPDLPRASWSRAALVLLMSLSSLSIEALVTKHFRAFEDATADFREVVRHVPRAPKLFYVVYDRSGTQNKPAPFVHLPAWIQAEKGGWLSFHFAVFGVSPTKYREPGDGAVVPPPVPLGWEWQPETYRHGEQDAFFDWFLIRSRTTPMPIFRGDHDIVLEAHRGTFWLFRRRERAEPSVGDER